MPYLNLKIGAPRSALPPERAASFLLAATRRILGKTIKTRGEFGNHI